MNLQAAQVEAWLMDHPDFFRHCPDLLDSLSLPHPDTGQAVSLVERQLLSLRERNRSLESRLTELIAIARENDALSEKVQAFALHLLAARSPGAVVETLLERLRESFRIPHVTLRLWGRGMGRPDGPERLPVQDDIRSFSSSLTAPLCGNHPVYEVNRWFGENGPRLRSFALAPLGQPAFGLLVLASEDEQRFYAEMGTAYLAQLAALCATALQATAPPADADATADPSAGGHHEASPAAGAASSTQAPGPGGAPD